MIPDTVVLYYLNIIKYVAFHSSLLIFIFTAFTTNQDNLNLKMIALGTNQCEYTGTDQKAKSQITVR